MDSLADVYDLGVRLGTELTGADEDRAQAVLDDVSAYARKTAGRTWDGSEGNVAPDDVVAVVLAAARRLYVNPNGFASEQDGDYSYRLPAETAAAGVFTDAEVELLESYRDTSGLWSLKLTGSPELPATVPVQGSEKPIHFNEFPWR